MIYLTARNHFFPLRWTYIHIIISTTIKASIVGTVYPPPSQGSFDETIIEHFSKINTNDTEIYILGDLNTICFQNKNMYLIKQILNQVKTYFQFCSFYGLE